MKCFAIGYQGRSVDDLCDELLDRGVELLIDVRERAWSNRPEFRKTALAEKLASRGIQYRHVREAGNPFRPRGGEAVDLRDCMRQYRRHLKTVPDLLPSLKATMSKLSAALFCYEAESDNCHRGVLLAQLQRSHPSLKVVHIED